MAIQKLRLSHPLSVRGSREALTKASKEIYYSNLQKEKWKQNDMELFKDKRGSILILSDS